MRDNSLQSEVDMSKKKKWSSTAKFEIALMALKGEVMLSEICNRYAVAPSQIHAWKKQLLEQGSHIFSKTEKASVVSRSSCFV